MRLYMSVTMKSSLYLRDVFHYLSKGAKRCVVEFVGCCATLAWEKEMVELRLRKLNMLHV